MQNKLSATLLFLLQRMRYWYQWAYEFDGWCYKKLDFVGDGNFLPFLFCIQAVYMHLKASFKVMARLVKQHIASEQDEEKKDTESYMFRLVIG